MMKFGGEGEGRLEKPSYRLWHCSWISEVRGVWQKCSYVHVAKTVRNAGGPWEHGLELLGSTRMETFSVNIINVFSLPYDLLNHPFLFLACRNAVCNTYDTLNMCSLPTRVIGKTSCQQ